MKQTKNMDHNDSPRAITERRRRGHSPLFYAAAGIGATMLLRAVLRRTRAYDLCGKAVLITGGSRGFGLVLARELAREGARIAICARNRDELNSAARELERLGADVFTLTCDVTDRKQIEDTVLAVQMHFGALDVLVNNAGILQVGPLESMKHEDYESAMNTNFWAPLNATLAALPEMGRKRSGRIVNIASIAGVMSVPHILPYDASKSALVGLSEGLRAELVRYGIYVTTVCPGFMRMGGERISNLKGRHQTEHTIFSLKDSAPVISQDAETVARKVILAIKRGEPEVLPNAATRIAAVMHGLSPGLTSDIWGLVNRALSSPPGSQAKAEAESNIEMDCQLSGTFGQVEQPSMRTNEMR